MNFPTHRCFKALLLGGLLWLVPFHSYSIERMIDDLSNAVVNVNRGATSGVPQSAELQEMLRHANEIIAEGRDLTNSLATKIALLESDKAALVQEQAKLKQVQSTLTSGLVGALATAVVAILGFVTQRLTSRAERQLKQLKVVAKIAELKGKNIPVPRKIAEKYETPSGRS